MSKSRLQFAHLRLASAAGGKRICSDGRVRHVPNTIPQPYPKNGGETLRQKGVRAHRIREASFLLLLQMRYEWGGNRAVDYEKRSVRCDFANRIVALGQGITTRAVALALHYAFCELGMEIVHSACLKRNSASARVLEKNGFQEMDGFIYNSSKFENEPARRFQLTQQAWIAANRQKLGNGCKIL